MIVSAHLIVEFYRERMTRAEPKPVEGRPNMFTVEYVRSNNWRWRVVSSANGKILADSGQGYSRRVDAVRGYARVVGVDEQDVRRAVEHAAAGEYGWEWIKVGTGGLDARVEVIR